MAEYFLFRVEALCSSPALSLVEKSFLPVEPPPQADLSFLFLLGAARFA
jgi:hypothetical protein